MVLKPKEEYFSSSHTDVFQNRLNDKKKVITYKNQILKEEASVLKASYKRLEEKSRIIYKMRRKTMGSAKDNITQDLDSSKLSDSLQPYMLSTTSLL